MGFVFKNRSYFHNSFYKKLKITIFTILFTIISFLPINISYADKKIKIAILPFTNLSEKKENDWIGSGFAETMLTSLSNLKSIQITERFLMNQVLKEISFQKSGFIEDKNLVKVGKLTGANVIISGSYQIVNNEIVVNSRYIDVEKGTVESGGAFYIRGDVNKIFDLEEKLANDFREKFSIVSTQQEENNIKSTIYSTSSIEANKLYLKAIERNMNGGYTGKQDAINLLKESIKIDPNYALALALLGEIEVDFYNANVMFSKIFRTNSNFQSYHKDGMSHIKKALSLAPESFQVNRAMSKILLSDNKEKEAEIYLNKSLSLKPDDVESIIAQGFFHKNKKLDYINQAFAVDNFNYHVYLEYGKYYIYIDKNLQKAVINLLKAIELNPNSWLANMQIVQAYIQANDSKSAVAWADRMLLLEKDKIGYMVAASAYLSVGDFKKIKELYTEIDKTENSPFIKSFLAGLYMKDKDYVSAFNLLKKSLETYPDDAFLNLSMSEIYLEYYNNCKFALYHHNLYIKNLDKTFLPEKILEKQKKQAQDRLKDLNEKCGY